MKFHFVENLYAYPDALLMLQKFAKATRNRVLYSPRLEAAFLGREDHLKL